MSERDEPLKREAVELKLLLREMKKERDAGSSVSDDQLREGRAFEARVRLLTDDLGTLRGRDSTNCNLKVTTCKEADALADTIGMVTSLHRGTMCLYDYIPRKVDGAFVEVSKHLKEAFICKARSLPQSVCEAVCAAKKDTRAPSAVLPGAMS